MNSTDNKHYSCTNRLPEGFYLESNSYKPCYPTCKTCNTNGNEIDNKCIQCIPNKDFVENNCLEHCNGYYFFNSNLHAYQCVEKCPIGYIYSKGKICKADCDTKDIFMKICNVNEPNQETKDMLTNKIKHSLLRGELDNIIDDVINRNNDDLLLQLPDTFYQITSSDNQNNNENEYNDISVIQIGNCEEILRSKYNFDDNDKIIIFKIDVREKDCNIPMINYEFYNIRTKEKLNLSYCGNSTLKVYLPADNVDENNLKKYNKSSEFYNDICYSYSENGLDFTNKDRKKVYNDKHLSLCEADCKYQGYDIDTKKSECDCNYKLVLENISDIIQHKDKIIDKFTNIKSTLNLNVAKCYKGLLSINNLMYNIGSYVLLVMIILNIICLILFLVKGYKFIINIIDDLAKPKINKVKFENVETTNKKTSKKKKKDKDKDKDKLSVNTTIATKANKYDTIRSTKSAKNRKNEKDKLSVNTSIANANKSYRYDTLKSTKSVKYGKIKKTESNLNNFDTKSQKEVSNRNIKIKGNKIKSTKGSHVKKIYNMDTKSINNNFNSTYKLKDLSEKKEKLKLNKKNKKASLSEYELEMLPYKQALKSDKRTFCSYYFYLLGRSQTLLFTFYTKNDYNIRSLKISIFIIFLALSYTINILFFTDDTMHNIILVEGKFNIIYELPKIIYSSLISSVINTLVITLALSEKNILEMKNAKENLDIRAKKVKKILKLKFLFFFLLGFLLLFIFWYYVSCFCLIYKNTQLYPIEDTAVNFGMSLLYPFGYCLIPGIFRIASLRAKNKNREKMYKFSKFIRSILI